MRLNGKKREELMERGKTLDCGRPSPSKISRFMQCCRGAEA